MRLLQVFFRGLLFFGTVFGLASSAGFLVYDRPGAWAAVGVTTVLLLLHTLRWRALWTKELKARRVQIVGDLEVFYVNDPSSHLFLMASPIGRGGAIYMTRGILSLLTAEELDALIAECDQALHRFGFGWNVFISTLQLRVIKFLSPGLRQLLYTSRSDEATATPAATLFALPVLGIVDLLRRFFLKTDLMLPESRKTKRFLFDKLLAESFVCPPRVTAVASAHALIDPWPRSILRTSPACLSAEA